MKITVSSQFYTCTLLYLNCADRPVLVVGPHFIIIFAYVVNPEEDYLSHGFDGSCVSFPSHPFPSSSPIPSATPDGWLICVTLINVTLIVRVHRERNSLRHYNLP